MCAERWNPAADLESLRWDVDRIVTNHDGERVWLGPYLDETGKRTGITDCCPADDPCDYHAAIADRSTCTNRTRAQKKMFAPKQTRRQQWLCGSCSVWTGTSTEEGRSTHRRYRYGGTE